MRKGMSTGSAAALNDLISIPCDLQRSAPSPVQLYFSIIMGW